MDWTADWPGTDNRLLVAIDIASGLAVTLVTALIVLGFVRMAFLTRGAMAHFAMGLILIHLAVLLRTLHRDVAWLWTAETYGTEIPMTTSDLIVSLVAKLLVMLSGYQSLKALYLAIPEADRPRYSMLTAALYPPWGIAALMRGAVRRLSGRAGRSD